MRKCATAAHYVPPTTRGHVSRPESMVVSHAETATANNQFITHPTTDSTLGSGIQRPPGAGGRTGRVTDPTDDSLGLYGHTTGDGADLRLGEVQQRGPRRRKTKGRIVIASLNMRGGNSNAVGDKWIRVNQVLRDSKIAVLALQETHLTNERLEGLNELFKASMVVLSSPDPENPAGARGVSFAVNTRIVAVEDLKLTEVIPGRAAILNFRWTGDRVLRILNVYAPNGAAENRMFWESVSSKLDGVRGRRPELMLGDLNLVESSLDRLPPHGDQADAVETLGRLVGRLGMEDGWRRNNPNTATGSQSRIDRIYVTEELMRRAEDWNMEGPGFPTDHRMVSVSLANYKAPSTGKGRWAFPQILLTDGEFVKTMRKMGLELQSDLENLGDRTDERNPQRLYQEFKTSLRLEARSRAKRLIPKIERHIAALEHDISVLLEGEDPNRHEVAILQDRLMKLEVKRFERKRRAVATKDWLKGESVSRYWTKLNALQLPRKRKTHVLKLLRRDGEDGEEAL
ncbi:DNase I-like protein [Polyporus arcularius HHB13444]|uniref:DNase I-like protein n=1 Tax=Polyporus arcularius HHB13444 TaxID=1314778 RepID=A0A5C3PHQ6_9APHY|nr:DNase I-like protein [Polyporus arcularius HHB13444]